MIKFPTNARIVKEVIKVTEVKIVEELKIVKEVKIVKKKSENSFKRALKRYLMTFRLWRCFKVYVKFNINLNLNLVKRKYCRKVVEKTLPKIALEHLNSYSHLILKNEICSIVCFRDDLSNC